MEKPMYAARSMQKAIWSKKKNPSLERLVDRCMDHIMNDNKWISVKDKMPEFGIGYRYLFFNGKREVTVGYAFHLEDSECIWIVDCINETNEIATHWMPLPKAPQE